jgi:hypothetical protein
MFIGLEVLPSVTMDALPTGAAIDLLLIRSTQLNPNLLSARAVFIVQPKHFE